MNDLEIRKRELAEHYHVEDGGVFKGLGIALLLSLALFWIPLGVWLLS